MNMNKTHIPPQDLTSRMWCFCLRCKRRPAHLSVVLCRSRTRNKSRQSRPPVGVFSLFRLRREGGLGQFASHSPPDTVDSEPPGPGLHQTNLRSSTLILLLELWVFSVFKKCQKQKWSLVHLACSCRFNRYSPPSVTTVQTPFRNLSLFKFGLLEISLENSYKSLLTMNHMSRLRFINDAKPPFYSLIRVWTHGASFNLTKKWQFHVWSIGRSEDIIYHKLYRRLKDCFFSGVWIGRGSPFFHMSLQILQRLNWEKFRWPFGRSEERTCAFLCGTCWCPLLCGRDVLSSWCHQPSLLHTLL